MKAVKFLKYIDKLLKVLKTDRNTFFTYILTLLTIYVAVDRVVEMLMMIFTGVAVSYWGPFTYTLALACPVFAFLFSGNSQFAKYDNIKVMFIYLYALALYIISLSMFEQWLNAAMWSLLLSVPNYVKIVTDFGYMVQPAFQAISIYLPLVTGVKVFDFCFMTVDDTKDIKDSIKDYNGIDLSKDKSSTGPYSFEMPYATNKETGKMVKIVGNKRFEPMLVCGVSGSGKTSLVFEPMIATDLEKKYFFKEASKELGFAALKTKLATLNCPYGNDYINSNFSLNMLTPVDGKEKLFKAYMDKLIYDDFGKITYKNLGLTYMAPDDESLNNIIKIAQNYNIKVNIIDPAKSNSLGLNPFALASTPVEASELISDILDFTIKTNDNNSEEMYTKSMGLEAVQNISILLSAIYSKVNNGELPTLENVIECLNDFDNVKKLCDALKQDQLLSNSYQEQIVYFTKNFYTNKFENKDFITYYAGKLNSILRVPGLKNVLCNKENNIDMHKMLSEGQVSVVCTRRGDLGSELHKIFGLIFLNSMQYAVLSRPGTEKSRIPHFLYIDEFPEFICDTTTALFTMYRKYKVGVVVSSQNLTQLEVTQNSRQTILTNCTSKIVFGNNSPEDNEFWSNDFGEEREWQYTQDLKLDPSKNVSSYGDIKGPKWKWKKIYNPGKFQSIGARTCIYKFKNDGGKNVVGIMKLNLVAAKHKEAHKSKTFDFSKYLNNPNTTYAKQEAEPSKPKFTPKKINFDSVPDDVEIDPIQTDITDSSYLFDNEDAIIFDIKNKKNSEN